MPEPRPNLDPSVPCAQDAEHALLGCLLIGGRMGVIELISPIVQAEDFFFEVNQQAFTAIMAAKGDYTVAAEALRVQWQGDKTFPDPFVRLLELIGQAETNVTRAEEYAHLIHRYATARLIIQSAGEMAQLGYKVPEEMEMMAAVEHIAATIRREVQPAEDLHQSGTDGIRNLMTRMDEVEKLYAAGRGMPDTPWQAMNSALSPFGPGQLITLAGPTGSGKCVEENTLVVSSQGEVKTIREWYETFANGGLSVMALNDQWKIVPTSVGKILDNGVQEVYEVFAGGARVGVTIEHPFLTPIGWKPLSDITVGDFIAKPSRLSTWGSISVGKEKARLLGYLIGDGGLTPPGIKFTNVDAMILEDLTQCLDVAFPNFEIRKANSQLDCITYRLYDHRQLGGSRNGGTWGAAKGVLHSRLKVWLSELGILEKLSKDKKIPIVVYRWCKEDVVQFLRALFSCDGSIYANAGRGSKYWYLMIGYGTASEQLAQGIHHLLLRFGIHAPVRYKPVMLKGHVFDSWNLDITDRASIERFIRDIGFIGEKAERARLYCSPESFRSDIWPVYYTELAKERLAKLGISGKAVARLSGKRGNSIFGPSGRGITRTKLGLIASLIGDKELAQFAESDIRWVQVKSIKSIGQRHVYDMIVPQVHNFVAGDMIVHNTILLECLAEHNARRGHMVLFYHLELPPEEMSKRSVMRLSKEPLERHGLDVGATDRSFVAAVGQTIDSWPGEVTYVHCPGWTAEQICGDWRAQAARKRVDLVIIDYLGMIEYEYVKGRTDEMNLARITATIKTAAEKSGIPCVLGHQVTKADRTSRDGQKITLTDYRGSGQVADKSKICLGLWNGPQADGTWQDGHCVVQVYVLKNTTGPLSTVNLVWIPARLAFRDVKASTDEYVPSPPPPVPWYNEDNGQETAEPQQIVSLPKFTRSVWAEQFPVAAGLSDAEQRLGAAAQEDEPVLPGDDDGTIRPRVL